MEWKRQLSGALDNNKSPNTECRWADTTMAYRHSTLGDPLNDHMFKSEDERFWRKTTDGANSLGEKRATQAYS